MNTLKCPGATGNQVSIFALLAIIVFGCGTDGTEPYALWDKYTHPEGRFSFYYLSPPFGQHTDSTDEHPVMVVGSFSEVTAGGLGSRIRLEAWYDSQMPMVDLAATRMQYWFENGYDVEGLLECESHKGDRGYCINARYGLDKVREVFFDYAQGAVVLSVWYHGDSSQRDIDILLSGFHPGDTGAEDE